NCSLLMSVQRLKVHPLIKVSNQLVAAPVGSNVDIGCDVEASPRAMNSWHRDTGEKLLASGKYEISEVPVNYYSIHMNLRILNVQKHDFGGYVCASVNALGKTEGGVRLQELHLPPKTTIVPVPATHDKSRKKPLPHSKDIKRKRKRLKGERREHEEDISGEEELVTIGSWLEPQTLQTIIPSASRPPSWILHRNDGSNSAAGSPSNDCRIVRLPLWATAWREHLVVNTSLCAMKQRSASTADHGRILFDTISESTYIFVYFKTMQVMIILYIITLSRLAMMFSGSNNMRFYLINSLNLHFILAHIETYRYEARWNIDSTYLFNIYCGGTVLSLILYSLFSNTVSDILK
ncbi:hypothetical protein L9F63_009396, partial [Diploptera punctata]